MPQLLQILLNSILIFAFAATVSKAAGEPTITFTCHFGHVKKIENGKTLESNSDTPTYFVIGEGGFVMSHNLKNSNGDVSVKKGWKGSNIEYFGDRIVVSSIIADSINMWEIDRKSLDVKWSVIGKGGTKMSETVAEVRMKCSR